ncbi:hypothetical protein CEE45_13785 [Candidatus Heimdallarchaeota archaeon B3_Heim]|nr:MAG: hypothetical protein CEE45_13785 [Candidatus Heimdallarchaeota archaeon B3_Heim]
MYTSIQNHINTRTVLSNIIPTSEEVYRLKKNYKEALITFIGGIGVFPILLSIFAQHIDFGLAIVIAFPFFLVTGVLNGLIVVTSSKPGPFILNKSQKGAVITLIGGIGAFVILIGLFLPTISFGYTLVTAYGFFLIAGTLGALIEERSTSEYKERYYPPENVDKTLNKQTLSDPISGSQCPSCGRQLEAGSIFCTHCGKKSLSS